MEVIMVREKTSVFQASYVLIVNHDKNHGWFTGSSYTYNEGDPTSPLYSIADQLADEGRFRQPEDMYFKFKICYPGTDTDISAFLVHFVAPY